MDKLANELYLNGELFCYFEFDGKTNWFYNNDKTKKISRGKFKNFQIKCSECGKLVDIITVTDKIQNKTYLCCSCRNKGERNGMFGKKMSEEVRRKLSESRKGELSHMYGKHLSEETKKKLRESHLGKYDGEKNPMFGKNAYDIVRERYGEERVNEIKKKISENVKGEKNPFYGKHHTEETKEKLRKYKSSEDFLKLVKSEEYRKKVSDGLKNSQKLKESRRDPEYRKKISEILKNSEKKKAVSSSEEYRKKRREITINRIEYLRSIGAKDTSYFLPNFNVKACKYFDCLMEQTKTNIQHALNGGEYIIKELGYFLDGYDEENNIVYEYDEPRHYDAYGNLRESDVKRQEEITRFLGCKFIRIKEKDLNT